MLQEKTPRTNIRSTERIRIGYSSSLNREFRRNEGEDDCGNSTNKGENMKKIVLSIALACVAPFAWGQVSETTTTTTTTDANGTITEYSVRAARLCLRKPVVLGIIASAKALLM